MRLAALLGLVVVLLGAAPAAGQGVKTVQVIVTSASGRSVYLDQGRGVGITPGLRVRLFLPGGASAEALIDEATTSSARIDLPPGIPLPPVGTRGEVDVPESPQEPQPQPAGPPQPQPQPPEHPPWTRQERERTPDTPLLAPAYSQRPRDRPTSVHGRVYTQFQYTLDQGEGRDSDYTYGRVGTWLEITNPFKDGGRILFAGDLESRGASLLDDGDETDTDVLIDRLSYAIGGNEYSAYRFEGGRFMSVFLPELGLVDGAEGALQFENGLRAGVGLGAYPEPFPDRNEGDDLGFHVFLDYQSPQPGRVGATVGYQKTWHEGEADRDMVVGRANFRPNDDWWLYGSVKVDIYSGSDTAKSGNVDLTELWLQARYAPDSTRGASVSFSHYTWPDLRRREYQYVPIELIQDGRVDRVDGSVWHDVAEDVRLTGRANYWSDQNDDGLGGEVSLDWDEFLGTSASLYSAVFYTDAAYADGMGFRIEARHGVGDLRGYIGYELFSYQTSGLLTGEEDLLRHAIRAGGTWQWRRWYYTLTADRYFGDGEDAWSFGLYAEYRF